MISNGFICPIVLKFGDLQVIPDRAGSCLSILMVIIFPLVAEFEKAYDTPLHLSFLER